MATLENPFAKARPHMVAARLEVLSQLARFAPGELTLKASQDAWSALELAHHIYITDGLFLQALQEVQQIDNPHIPEIAATPQSTHEAEPPVSFEAVLSGMAARREEIFEFLQALPPEAWERPLHYAQAGQLQFYQLVNQMPLHDQEHARQLASLKEAITPVQS
jgi:hypothetical protein